MQQKKKTKNDKGVIFKNCVPSTKCISEINNTQVDYAQETDVVISIHSSVKYSDNYSKTFRSLWKYYRNKQNAP